VDTSSKPSPAFEDGEMTNSLIQLDPTVPVSWETPAVLRFGFDRALVRLRQPSVAAQKFISSLRDGISDDELVTESRAAGITSHERRELLNQLSPVLLRAPRSGAQSPLARNLPTVAVYGKGAIARAVTAHLTHTGFLVAESSPGFAIVIEQFLAPASQSQHLLLSDISHLLIRATDRSVSVGPVVLPGGAPCLSCVELHGLDRDPQAPLLAAQLAHQAAGAESPACAQAIAALTLTLTHQVLHGTPELVGTRLHFAVRDGRVSSVARLERVSPHPRCGCVALNDAQAA
jgi:hypothetical protein